MASFSIRPAGQMDAAAMVRLLNAVIAEGGTTAYVHPISVGDFAARIAQVRSAWHLVEDDAGDVLGFQWINPHTELGTDVASIATFTKLGLTGLGIGSALFKRTEQAARQLGYVWINADIRADNTGGLIYYQSRGFEDWGRKTGVELGDGTIVDKVLKRYDLD